MPPPRAAPARGIGAAAFCHMTAFAASCSIGSRSVPQVSGLCPSPRFVPTGSVRVGNELSKIGGELSAGGMTWQGVGAGSGPARDPLRQAVNRGWQHGNGCSAAQVA